MIDTCTDPDNCKRCKLPAAARGSLVHAGIPIEKVQAAAEAAASRAPSVLDVQIGGDHYKKLGQYQPWEVLRRWLTPEEFRGYMKGTAVAYLARELDKGGMQDIEKAMHTLQGLIDLTKNGDGTRT